MLTGPDRAEVDGRPVAFRTALLATGAAPFVPPIPGLADANYLTSETLWRLTEQPDRLIVLGGGPIGCELGQAFARLGTQVTVVDGAYRLLPREDPDASALVADALLRDGVQLQLGRPAAEVRPGPDGGELRLDDGTTLPYGQLLVAVGRRARTDGIGCSAAGIELGPGGVVLVDEQLRTTNPRVRAAGAIHPHRRCPWQPRRQQRRSGSAPKRQPGRAPCHLHLPGGRRRRRRQRRAATGRAESAALGAPARRPRHPEDDTAGFTTLVVDHRSRLLGATIVARAPGRPSASSPSPSASG